MSSTLLNIGCADFEILSMSMAHRASLLLDTNLLQQQINMYCSTMPWLHRLKRGENVCVASARAIVKIWTEDSCGNHCTQFLLRTLTPPLLAIYGLAIFILKHPRGNLVQSDLMVRAVSSAKKPPQKNVHANEESYLPMALSMLKTSTSFLGKILDSTPC